MLQYRGVSVYMTKMPLVGLFGPDEPRITRSKIGLWSR